MSALASEILSLSLEHLELVFITILIAASAALPAAILLTRRARTRRWVMGFANLAQTIPSLALFGFLLPLIGIGKATAIVALCLYALLPILRNTLLGITGVDAAVRESAVAMGMTERQILWQVELPLASPAITINGGTVPESAVHFRASSGRLLVTESPERLNVRERGANSVVVTGSGRQSNTLAF